MNTDKRFINEVFRIIQGALRLDIDKVRNYTNLLVEKLENEGERVLATRLRTILDGSDRQLRPADASFGNAVPVDSESRFPLVEPVLLYPQEPEMVLQAYQWEMVDEFVSVAKSSAHLDTMDPIGSLSLLMYGPPGTGKSRLARHLAQELGLTLYIARLDGLISSYLGSTSKNIRAIFEFASKRPCVLFLDEFDAIAKLRGDSQELGELKRVVNSFIQNLDTIGRQSIVIAATNHHELLDAAIWRRFSYRIELSAPESDMRRQMWTQFSEPLELTKQELELLVDLSEGFSGSDIMEVCVRLKRYRMTTDNPPSFRRIFSILQNMSIGYDGQDRIASKIRALPPKETATLLRERDTHLYSHAAIAHLFDVSKSTAYRWSTKKD